MSNSTRTRALFAVIISITMLFFSACGGLATGGGGGSEGGLKVVRFGSVGGMTDAGLYLADQRGYFEQAGIKVNFKRMDSGPALTNAVATGQLDVAGISVTPGLFSAFTQDINMKIVGDKQSMRSGFSATQLVAKPNLVGSSTGETLRNLNGKTLAISAKASSAYVLLADLLKKHGMNLNDVRITELSYSNMSGALSTGAVDGAIMLEPFLTQATASGEAKVVSDLLEVVPREGITIVPIVYSGSFINDRATAQKFMTAYMRGVRDYNRAYQEKPPTPEVINTIAKRADIDPNIAKSANPGGLHPDQHVNQRYLGHLQDFFARHGMLRTPVDVRKTVDSSFAENAVQQLGEYQ